MIATRGLLLGTVPDVFPLGDDDGVGGGGGLDGRGPILPRHVGGRGRRRRSRNRRPRPRHRRPPSTERRGRRRFVPASHPRPPDRRIGRRGGDDDVRGHRALGPGTLASGRRRATIATRIGNVGGTAPPPSSPSRDGTRNCDAALVVVVIDVVVVVVVVVASPIASASSSSWSMFARAPSRRRRRRRGGGGGRRPPLSRSSHLDPLEVTGHLGRRPWRGDRQVRHRSIPPPPTPPRSRADYHFRYAQRGSGCVVAVDDVVLLVVVSLGGVVATMALMTVIVRRRR